MLVSIGTNIGDLKGNLERALQFLTSLTSIQILKKSSYYQTFPVGGPKDQPSFLNMAILLKTTLSPNELLQELHAIEKMMKRKREVFWGPRVIDLDIILYGNTVLESEELTIPHPRFQWRDFVLSPACEIGPHILVPVFNLTVEELKTILNWTFSTFPLFSLFLERTLYTANISDSES
ncbi:MAG: 2-amino-4-hydroxy-6-hydroxymethyldihydropteridine diphosphokinase [Thermoguttaceae bacterium]